MEKVEERHLGILGTVPAQFIRVWVGDIILYAGGRPVYGLNVLSSYINGIIHKMNFCSFIYKNKKQKLLNTMRSPIFM